jgi:hypothetical protein
MWRTDLAANTGLDPVGHRRESLLVCLAFLLMYRDMRPRSRGDPMAKPQSCMNKLYAVRRAHERRGLKMVSLSMVDKVMKGMLRDYILEHDVDALAPKRKVPFTNDMIIQMLATPDGASLGTLAVNRQSYFWVSAFATVATLAETGQRKGDISKPKATTPFQRGRMTFAKLVWRIAGEKVPDPSLAQLDSLGGHHDDGAWMVHGVMKNDVFAGSFGSKPSWLPYSNDAPRCAARHLARLERWASVHGASRATTPLFGPAPGEEWYHSLIDRVLALLLRRGCGLSDAEARAYSMHSFRIYLACALYSAGCPRDRILAIVRWRSDESLAIYARLNDSERASWVARSMLATVDSTVAAHLPHVDSDDLVAALMAENGLGEVDAE